jgi:ornithine carbamoyltransferase
MSLSAASRAAARWHPTQFLSILDVTPQELESCLDLAASMKAARHARRVHATPLQGQHVALLFEKPSLRTRSTFQIAIRELGGEIIEPPSEVALGGRERIDDVARNLERWVFGAVIRTFAQSRLEHFAAAAPGLRVVNALTNEEHPCQALADCLTLIERFKTIDGRTVAFIGDGNNVAASLAQAMAMLGGHLIVASPAGFELPTSVVESVERVARFGGGVTVTNDPAEAVLAAEAIYTDVWASMGQEAEAEARLRAFEGFQVDDRVMSAAAPGAVFMHCLPAHRGEEVAASVVDGPQSRVIAQAHNRLHSVRGLLAWLVEEADG